MSLWAKHKILETNAILLLFGALIVIAIGGLVEIVPLFYLKSTIEVADGVRPYTPLELAGRNIYVREGCYNCHSQMIRPLRDEVERYGHYSLAAESMYDRPFQWGSKRTGPDLQREGGKYPNMWHFQHMLDPRSTSAGSIMPAYPWLFTQTLDSSVMPNRIAVLRALGVPFPDRTGEEVRRSMIEQGTQIAADLGKSGVKIQPDREIIAVIAYLQQLGRTPPDPEAAQASVK